MAPGGEEHGKRYPITQIASRFHENHAKMARDLRLLGEAEDVEQIRVIADELPELLKEHFDEEERPGGLFDELESLRPVIDSQLKFMRQEHREIMETLEGLRRQFQEADVVTNVGELEQRHDHIRVSTAAFVQLIRHHELVEARLVTDTYYTEDGGSG